MKKKLKNKKGETLVEILASVLIISLSMAVLAGAIVTAAKINRESRTVSTSFDASSVTEESGTAVIRFSESSEYRVSVTVYRTADDAYSYYKKPADTSADK